ATARLAHYVIPARLPYEMPGTTIFSEFISMVGNGFGLPEPFAQYTPALVEPPAGSDVIDPWRLLFRLAQRLKVQLQLFPGVGEFLPGGEPTELDMTAEPDDEAMFDLIHAGSRI